MLLNKLGIQTLSVVLCMGLLGCDKDKVEENKAPVAVINSGESEKTICQGSSMVFNSEGSHDTDGEIASYKWSNQNGDIVSTNRTFSKSFPNTGEYKYTLTVEDTQGAEGSTTYTVTVGSPEEWTILDGTGTNDAIVGMSTDNEGNIITTGYTMDTNDSTDKFNVNVMKVSKAGDILWSRDYNSSEHEIGYDTATDGNDNIYVVGMTKGDFGDTEATCGANGSVDPFVIKLDKDGEMQWGRLICTDKAGLARGVGVDAGGNVYVAGNISGDLDGTSSLGKNDVFVAKFDSDGNKKHFVQIGTGENEFADSLVVDASGNAYVTGYTKGAIGETNAGGYDIFVSKVSTDGSVDWSTQFGSDDTDKNPAIALDVENELLYVTGKTKGGINGNNTGGYDIFLTSLALDGTIIMKKQYGSQETEVAEDIVVSPDGNILIAGNVNVVPNEGTTHSDVTVLKISPDGTLLSQITKGSDTKDYAYGIALGSCNSVYVGGYTRGNLEGKEHSDEGLNDKFVMHIDTFNMPSIP